MRKNLTHSFLAAVGVAVLAGALVVTAATACPDGDNLYLSQSGGTSTAAAAAAPAAPGAMSAAACTGMSCCSATCYSKHGGKAGDCAGCAAHAAMCKAKGCHDKSGAAASATEAPAAAPAPTAAGRERWKGLPDSMIQKLEQLSGQTATP